MGRTFALIAVVLLMLNIALAISGNWGLPEGALSILFVGVVWVGFWVVQFLAELVGGARTDASTERQS